MDTLRPPAPLDPRPEAYRDWLHFNLFDRGTGLVGLVNLSLHGAPDDPQARAVGTAVVHHPDHGWLGNMEVCDLSFARLSDTGINLECAAIFVDPLRDRLYLSARFVEDGLLLECVADATSRMLRVEQKLPFGSGWISWSVVPRMKISGSMTIAGQQIDLARCLGYHDHNWGRWFWGDDLGWDWGIFSDAASETTIVFSRATDRGRRHKSPFLVTVEARGRRHSFSGEAVHYRWLDQFTGPLKRVPGTLAVLHSDRRQPRLPGRVVLEADDGHCHLRIELRIRAAAQFIAKEPTRPGTSFVHELVGEFEGELGSKGETRLLSGLGIVEYVD